MQDRQRLALLFDINRTILIEDKAAGKTREDEICSILAACSFGKVSEQQQWTPELDHPLQYHSDSEGCVSYYHFVQEILYPFPNTEGMPLEEKHKRISDIKDARRALLKAFLCPDNPGIHLLENFKSIVEATEQPVGFSLLPSFYEAVSQLEEDEVPFSLCFRTFGEDIKAIRKEWDLFCDGNHPSFPKFRSPHRKLKDRNLGAFFRSGPRSEDCHLIMGTIKQPPLTGTIAFYEGMDVDIYSGFKAIDHFLQTKYKLGETLAIRDYYPWWAAQGERHDSGKILLVGDEHTNPSSTRPLQIFFDDNLWIDEFLKKGQLIMDARKIDNGESYPNVPELFGKMYPSPTAICYHKQEVLSGQHCSSFTKSP